MRITSAEFVLGVAHLRQLPKESIREVAFIGRSNVGKSSLINRLCNRKTLAHSSKGPGKTRELNYYTINKELYFVDLPGYGYAKVPEQIRASWGKLIEQYLKNREQLVLAVQLIDSRHEPTELDLMMVGWLEYFEVPFVVVLTKADKLPRSKMPLYLRTAKQAFARFKLCKDVIPFSSITGEGRSELLKAIGQHLEG